MIIEGSEERPTGTKRKLYYFELPLVKGKVWGDYSRDEPKETGTVLKGPFGNKTENNIFPTQVIAGKLEDEMIPRIRSGNYTSETGIIRISDQQHVAQPRDLWLILGSPRGRLRNALSRAARELEAEKPLSVVSLESYVRPEKDLPRLEGGAWNLGHEDAIDWTHLQEDLKDLSDTGEVVLICDDRAAGCRALLEDARMQSWGRPLDF
eukprot:s2758_g4.t1